jgi:hypothetical protein
MELRKHSEMSGSSSAVRKRIDFFENLAKEAELAKDLKKVTQGDQKAFERLNATPSQLEEIQFISQMQEEGSSSYKNSDYKDYQRLSDIIRAVGIVRPQIEKLLYEGKIEVLPERAMEDNIDIREVNGKVRIVIKHDLKFEAAMMAMINALDTHDQFRALFQGDIKPLQQNTSDIEALYRDAELARQELHHFIEEFSAQTGARNTLLPACLKDKGRLHDKAKSELDGDVSRVTDIARGAIVYPTINDIKIARAQMESALHAVSPHAKIVRVIDRFVHPTATGYRDMWCDIQMSNGHIAELHLRLAAIDDVAGEQHKLYEEARSLRVDVAREGRTTFNDQERQKLLVLNKRSRKLFEEALNNS